MRVVLISDTHTRHLALDGKVPEGDIILHGGDIMGSGYDPTEIVWFLDWYSELPHKHKIFIAGNHDRDFENNPDRIERILEDYPEVTYLQDKLIDVDGLKVYGSPWQPEFCNWAFNLKRNGEDLEGRWAAIPEEADIVVTHGPPENILDFCIYDAFRAGCERLLPHIKRVKPLIHLFGHIHESYGVWEEDGTMFVNASVCTLAYRPINDPIIVDIVDGKAELVHIGENSDMDIDEVMKGNSDGDEFAVSRNINRKR